MNKKIQNGNPLRQQLDSTGNDETEPPKPQQRTTRMTKGNVFEYFTKVKLGLRCNLCINPQKVGIMFLILIALYDIEEDLRRFKAITIVYLVRG